MSDYSSKISDFMGSALAIVDVLTEAAGDSMRAAGAVVETEVMIKRRQSERAKLIYTLGEDAFKAGVINKRLVERIHEIDEQIAELKAQREKRKSADEDEDEE